MGMRNCVKWTLKGVSYEFCDLGTSLIAHLPSPTGREAKTIPIGRDTTWALENLGRSWSDDASLTIREAEGCAVTLSIPSTVGQVLERWLTRVAKRQHTGKSPG